MQTLFRPSSVLPTSSSYWVVVAALCWVSSVCGILLAPWPPGAPAGLGVTPGLVPWDSMGTSPQCAWHGGALAQAHNPFAAYCHHQPIWTFNCFPSFCLPLNWWFISKTCFSLMFLKFASCFSYFCLCLLAKGRLRCHLTHQKVAELVRSNQLCSVIEPPYQWWLSEIITVPPGPLNRHIAAA